MSAAITAEERAADREFANAEDTALRRRLRQYLDALDAADAMAEASEPYLSGGKWGELRAWIVEGAPDRESGIQAAKWITRVQVALENALATYRTHVQPPTAQGRES